METKKKTIWFVKILLILCLVFLIPFLFIAYIVFLSPVVYGDTFVGVLKDKCERLYSIEEPKIIVIGGSSVPFGLDSAMIEEELDMPVVNFGLYADLGTKLMLDLSEDAIKEGDIIVIAPELNAQTLSLYFNGKTTHQAFDNNRSLYSKIKKEDLGSLIGDSFSYTLDKMPYILGQKKNPVNDGAYQKDYCNKYGDNTYPREYNVMGGVNPSIHFDYFCNFDDTQTTSYEEFIEYLNQYIFYANRKGATVYYSFAPISEMAIYDDVSQEDIDNYILNLSEHLHCRIISNINDYIMDDRYFYDTEFHLNNAGAKIRTVRLIDDLKRTLGDSSITLLPSDLPPPPPYPDEETILGEEGSENFIFELYTVGGNSYYRIIGLSEIGKMKESLIIPNQYLGLAVRHISENAFLDSPNLKMLTLGFNIRQISSNAFCGAMTLERIIIPDGMKTLDITVPNDMGDNILMTNGANPNLKIVVPKGQIEEYALEVDYLWGAYADMLVEE